MAMAIGAVFPHDDPPRCTGGKRRQFVLDRLGTGGDTATGHNLAIRD
jgi:hypothetical protein